MLIHAYIRVLSGEANVRAIQNALNLPDSIVKATKAIKDHKDGVWWNWMTPQNQIESSGIGDDGVKTILEKYRPLFPIIKKHAAAEAEIYLEIITQYGQGEDPGGLYLSAETIRLLAELGAALDHDVYCK